MVYSSSYSSLCAGSRLLRSPPSSTKRARSARRWRCLADWAPSSWLVLPAAINRGIFSIGCLRSMSMTEATFLKDWYSRLVLYVFPSMTFTMGTYVGRTRQGKKSGGRVWIFRRDPPAVLSMENAFHR